MITVYDKTMDVRLRFEGLKIKSAVDADFSYIYTISDPI